MERNYLKNSYPRAGSCEIIEKEKSETRKEISRSLKKENCTQKKKKKKLRDREQETAR